VPVTLRGRLADLGSLSGDHNKRRRELAGKLVHFEIPADDTARVKEFYGNLFGWKYETYEGPVEYHMLQGIEPGGGIYPTQEGEKGIRVYYETDDIDGSIERVRELGGTVKSEKAPVPAMGWFAHCEDTEGNQFSIWQGDESAPVPEGMGAETASSS